MYSGASAKHPGASVVCVSAWEGCQGANAALVSRGTAVTLTLTYQQYCSPGAGDKQRGTASRTQTSAYARKYNRHTYSAIMTNASLLSLFRTGQTAVIGENEPNRPGIAFIVR